MIHIGPSQTQATPGMYLGSMSNYALNGWSNQWNTTTQLNTNSNVRHKFNKLPESLVVDKIQIGPYLIPSQLCSFQTFGYSYCTVTDLSVSMSDGSPLNQPLVMLPGTPITILITPSFKIDEAGTITNRNGFCKLGSDLVIIQDSTILANSTITQDSNTLAYNYVLNPQSPVLDPSSLSIGYRDWRLGSSTYSSKDFQIQDGSCSIAQLSNGEVTFYDLSPVRTVEYLQNTGIQSFSYYVATPNCLGWKSMTIELFDSENQLVNTDLIQFNKCKVSTNTVSCFYLDTTTKKLFYYSMWKALNKNSFNKSFSFAVTQYSQNVANVIISQLTTTSFTFQQSSCDFTEFNPTLVQSNVTMVSDDSIFELQGKGCADSAEFISFSFTDSISQAQQSTTQDEMSWCGKRSILFSADADDQNYYLASQLIDGDQQDSFIGLDLDLDGYLSKITFKINDIVFVDKPLKFQIEVGLEAYTTNWVTPSPKKVYDLTLTIPKGNSMCKEKVCVVESFAPTVFKSYMTCSIGIGAQFFTLPNYEQKPDCQYSLLMMTVVQTGGFSIPQSSFSTNLTTFEINTSDQTLQNQVLEFKFKATLRNQDMLQNEDFRLIVTFVAVPSKQEKDWNTAPVFDQILKEALPIPCLNDNSVISWIYTFSKASDLQANYIYFSRLKCPSIPENFFVATSSKGFLELTINTRFPFQPAKTQETCQMTLRDQLGKTSTYYLVLQISCDGKKTHNDSEFLVEPKPVIRSINQNGTIEILWNVDLVLPEILNLTSLPTQVLQINVVIRRNSWPGDDMPIAYTYTISAFEKRRTVVQLRFAVPGTVSNNNIKDKLQIFFNDSNSFVTIQNLSLPINYKLEGLIPIQQSEGISEVDQSLSSKLTKAVLLIVATSFVLSFLLTSVLNFLLSFVKSLALIIHMFVVSLNFPLNLMKFVGTLFPLVTFSLVPTDQLFERIFHFNEIKDNNPITDQFDLAGYSSLFSVQNMGSLYCLITLVAAVPILLKLVIKFAQITEFNNMQIVLQGLLGQILWNGVISFSYNNFLVIATSSFLESNDLRFGPSYSATENYCSLLSILGMIFCVTFPLALLATYWFLFKSIKYKQAKENDKLACALNYGLYLQNLKRHEPRMNRFGNLLQTINFRQTGIEIAMVTPILDLTRQLILAIAVTRLIKYPTFAIFFFNFIFLFHLMFLLYFQPYKDKYEQTTLYINEGTVLFINYHLFLFTPFVDQQNFVQIGNSVKIVILSNIGLNVVIGGIQALRKVPFKIKLLLMKSYRAFKQKKLQHAKAKAPQSNKDINGTVMQNQTTIKQLEKMIKQQETQLYVEQTQRKVQAHQKLNIQAMNPGAPTIKPKGILKEFNKQKKESQTTVQIVTQGIAPVIPEPSDVDKFDEIHDLRAQMIEKKKSQFEENSNVRKVTFQV